MYLFLLKSKNKKQLHPRPPFRLPPRYRCYYFDCTAKRHDIESGAVRSSEDRKTSSVYLHGEAERDAVDDAVVALDVDRIVGVGPEGLLPDDGVVDEVLPDRVAVLQRHAADADEGRRGHGAARDLALDDVELEDVGGEGAAHGLVRLEGRVGGGEDREGPGALQLGGDPEGAQGGVELAEVVVPAEVGLLVALGDAQVAPDLPGSLEAREGGEETAEASPSRC